MGSTAETSKNRLAYPIDEAARLLGVGRTTLYRLVGEGKITAVKIGGRTVVPATELEDYLQRQITKARTA